MDQVAAPLCGNGVLLKGFLRRVWVPALAEVAGGRTTVGESGAVGTTRRDSRCCGPCPFKTNLMGCTATGGSMRLLPAFVSAFFLSSTKKTSIAITSRAAKSARCLKFMIVWQR